MQVSKILHQIKQKYSQKNRNNIKLKGGKRAAFFTGGNSTCGAHICCHSNVYKQRCKEGAIPENHHAIPREILRQMEEEKSMGKKQVKIDNIVLEKSTAPQEFTREGVLHAVAQFVACDDQVVWLVILKYPCHTDKLISPWLLQGKTCSTTVQSQ